MIHRLPFRFPLIGASLVALAMLSATTASPVAAQQATPAVAITPGPVPGSECTTAPLPIDFLGILVQTPVPSEPYVAPTAIPAGVAPSVEIQAEVIAAVRQYIACANSGDVLRGLAVLEPTFLRRALDPSGDLDPDNANDVIASIATPTTLTDEQLVTLVAIQTIVQSPDGTVATVVETDGGVQNAEGTNVDLLIWEKLDGVWKLKDAVVDIDDVIAKQTPASN